MLPKSYFGEIELIEDKPRNYEVTCISNKGMLLWVEKDDFL